MGSRRHTWVPFGPAIRRIREAKGITVEDFCAAVNCIPETLERLERRHTKTQPYGRLVMYAKQILKCEISEIGCPIDEVQLADPDNLPLAIAAEPRKPTAKPQDPLPRPGALEPSAGGPDFSQWVRNRQFISKLERIVLAEHEAGLDAPARVRWGDTDDPALTARALGNVHSACGVHENERYAVTAQLLNQRRMNTAEQTVLRCRGGKGSRFQLAKAIATEPDPLSLTVFSHTLDQTHRLQLFLGKTVRVLVRVVVAMDDPEHEGQLSVTNPSGGKRIPCPPDWKSFFVFDSAKTTEWGLLVEQVSEPLDSPPSGPRQRRPR